MSYGGLCEAAERLGVGWREVEEADLERMRLHRNAADVRRWLEDEREISAEQQAEWFRRTRAQDFRIACVRGEAVGIARVSRGGVVGCDAFPEHRGAGGGAAALWAAIQCQIREHHARPPEISLWAFLENAPAVALYLAAGFAWCRRTDVRWLMRSDGAARAYAKMVLEW